MTKPFQAGHVFAKFYLEMIIGVRDFPLARQNQIRTLGTKKLWKREEKHGT